MRQLRSVFVSCVLVVLTVACLATSFPYEQPGVYVGRKQLTSTRLIHYIQGDGQIVNFDFSSAVHTDAVVNDVPYKFDVYIRPASDVGSGGAWTDPETIEVWPVTKTVSVAGFGDYYVIGEENLAHAWREADVRVGGSAKEPLVAAKFTMEISPKQKTLNNLFIMGRRYRGINEDCFLLRVR